YIPNSLFTTIAVENPSRMSNRRIYETIGIRYDDIDQLPTIVAQVEEMLKNHPEIDTRQTLMVNFNAFAASSIDFFIYTFTRTTNWQKYHQVKQDVLIRISVIIAAVGAEVAFPTSTIHLADIPGLPVEQVAEGDTERQ
ncbi:MAG: mechanosensitive ion channel family protein, partial [Gammaproteobacteria bacterium]